jgi:hypothetical protein
MPYQGASEMYLDKFVSIMREMGNDNPDVAVKMAAAQALWDATMVRTDLNKFDTLRQVMKNVTITLSKRKKM